MGGRCCCPKRDTVQLQPDDEFDFPEKMDEINKSTTKVLSAWEVYARPADTYAGNENGAVRCASTVSSEYQPIPGRSRQSHDDSCYDILAHSRAVFSSELGSPVSYLQHIADREPEDVETDPSLNPVKKTLFMKRSARDVEMNLRKQFYHRQKQERSFNPGVKFALRRCNSSSTVFVDNSTITNPDKQSTVFGLSNAIHLHIKNRDRLNRQCLPTIFDERLHPIQSIPLPKDYRSVDPSQQQIHNFVQNIFHVAQLNAECAIVTLVYIERLLASTEAELSPVTWRRAVLCAILLASKVWDDQAVWNVDYCQIISDLKVNDINELERQFLEIIQFNINVPSSVYAKYYFDIRFLNGANLEKCQLSLDKAAELEAFSRLANTSLRVKLQQLHKPPLWGSLDTLTNNVKMSNAVLS